MGKNPCVVVFCTGLLKVLSLKRDRGHYWQRVLFVLTSCDKENPEESF